MQASGPPVRVPNGLKGNRLSLILAVLSKHARMPLYKVPTPAPARLLLRHYSNVCASSCACPRPRL